MIGQLIQPIEAWTWDRNPDNLPRGERWSVQAVRLLHVLVRDISDGQLTMRAMSLVYTTLLSLAPLLALAFSLLTAFGVHNVLRPTLTHLLAPLGANADELVGRVIGFVDKIGVGALGAVGLATLLYAVISLIQKVEASCNFVWQVRRARGLGRRFSEYLSVLLVAPLLIVAAGSMTASVTSNALVQQIAGIEPFGTTLLLLGKLVPFLLWSAGFTFLFLFMPNTRVRLAPAIAGGLVSGVLWQTASLAFAKFASAGGNYNAIYAGFAIFFFLLIWLYLSWLIMLLGCRVAFLLQHPEELRQDRKPPRLSAAREESLALLVMGLIAHNYVHNEPPWRVDRLAHYLGAYPDHVEDVVSRLVGAGFLVETGEDAACVVPRRDIDTLGLAEVLAIIRSGSPASEPKARDAEPHDRVSEIVAELDAARRNAVAGVSVRQLAGHQSLRPQSEPAELAAP